MEVQSPSVKPHYDITMSRRTRKQQQFSVQGNEKTKSAIMDDATPTKDVHVTLETKTTQTISIVEVKESGGESDHKSLKQLIIGDDHKVAKKGNNNNNSDDERGIKGSRNSLGEHFTEEEKQQHLQVVRMQQNKENLQGLKFKKLVRRYAKVLGHLMKAKRDPHLGEAGKKPIFKLST